MRSRLPVLAAGAGLAALLIGVAAAVYMVFFWSPSATVEFRINGWTLPVSGVFDFNRADAPQGLRFLLPWQEGQEVSVTAGKVESIDGDRLAVRVLNTDDTERFTLADGVQVYRGLLPSGRPLSVGESVVVFSVDGRVQVVLAGMVLQEAALLSELAV